MSHTHPPLVIVLLCLLLLSIVKTVSGESWHELSVANEHRCSPYDRDDYPYPQSVERQIVNRQGMASLYTGRTFANLSESDIDHVVAISEAHDSGLCAADMAKRRRFAQDLDNLTLAAPRLNRHEKRAKDAGEWMPPQNRCWFARTVVAVKLKYGLTVDRREYEALATVIGQCEIHEESRRRLYFEYRHCLKNTYDLWTAENPDAISFPPSDEMASPCRAEIELTEEESLDLVEEGVAKGWLKP